jgi:hypothetical protein
MARRRALTGRPLLLAATTAAMVGCRAKAPVGNLVAPPTPPTTVCVDPTPSDAEVRIVAPVERRMSSRCVQVELAIGLAPLPVPPVGNLMPPPVPEGVLE